MKVRKKIIVIMIPVILLIFILVNLSFYLFFRSYLIDQEQLQVSTVGKSITSFIEEKENKYQGSVNDWGHWDDTYNYLIGKNLDYLSKNIAPSTFTNLDINFIVYTRNNGTVVSKYYYDLNKQAFSDFPSDFSADFNKMLETVDLNEDNSGICSLGNKFYFVATTKVTDSAEEHSNGVIAFGKLIDESIITSIEKTTSCKVDSIRKSDESILQPSVEHTILNGLSLSGENTLLVEYLYPSAFGDSSSIKFTFIKARIYFIDAIKKLFNFALLDIAFLGLAFLAFFILLGLYLANPLFELIRDIRKININDNEIETLKEYGNDEIAYIRSTINQMIKKIESGQAEIRDKEEKLYATLMSVGDGVIVVDKFNRVQLLNPVAQKITGWTQEKAFGNLTETVFRIVSECTKEPIASPVKLVFETEEPVAPSNHTILISKDGTERPIEDTAIPIRDKKGNIIGCLLILRDFSEKKEKQSRIEYLSYHDQLTGAYNRVYLEEALKRVDLAKNLPISFIYADVNGLKTINDAFGHHTGDKLIVNVAETFMAECRPEDIIVRTGGDEFAILLPKTPMSGAEGLVKRILDRIGQNKIMDISISLSFGWDTKVLKKQSALEVLKNAENFMYKKKIYDSASVRNAVIKSILNTLNLKSPREDNHSKRVSLLCEALGKAYGLGEEEIRELRIAGELHDIGKIAVDEAVLNKPADLTEAEWAQINSHPETGYRILGTSSEYYNIAQYVLAHHERWDGTGYPKGLKGENIPWKSRIIAVADSYDAMTCKRPYRKALSKKQALEEVRKNAGTQFDPGIVKVFIEEVIIPDDSLSIFDKDNGEDIRAPFTGLRPVAGKTV